MARFTFRLTALLRLRESRRNECRAALAEAYRVDEVLLKQVETIGRELDALRKFCRITLTSKVVNVDRLVEAQRYELIARAQQQRLVEQRQQVAQEIKHRRQALVEADREVRVLEKLRERSSSSSAATRRSTRRSGWMKWPRSRHTVRAQHNAQEALP